MIVTTLNPTTYVGGPTVEGYSSLIWTERYLHAGEFEMHTPLIDKHRLQMPEESLIAIADSTEVMIVESHEIDRDDSGAAELVLKGRTFETLLEQRFIGNREGYRQPWKMQSSYPDHGAALALIWDTIVNPTNFSELSAVQYGHDVKENIPNVRTSERTYGTNPWMEWWLEPGDVYTKVIDFLMRGGYGIRNCRPGIMKTGSQMKLDGTGNLQVDPVIVDNALWIETYNGVDRTRNQSVRPAIEFSYEAGHLETPKYLFSNKNLRNVAEVISSVGSVFVYLDDDVSPYLTGRNRKMLLVDGGDAGDEPLNTFLTALVQKGEIELKKHNREAAMDATVSVNAPFKYGVDYALGDRVTVSAEYGFTNLTMMVSEYIRTEDEDGDRGYPTLSLPV